MKNVILNDGFEISPISIGCWSFGGGSYWGDQSQKDVDAVVHGAIDAGVKLFDTAEMYNDGESEISLGKALEGGWRERASIMAKVPADFSHKKDLIEHCEASLRRLRTDYLDVYSFHWPLDTVPGQSASVEEAFEGLMLLKEQGKIRHVALSNFGKMQMEEVFAQTKALPVLNELIYNLLSRGIESEVIPTCKAHGMGVLAYMPLQQSLLTGKYARVEDVPPNQVRTRHFDCTRGGRHGGVGAEQETFAVVNAMRRLSEEYGISMSHMALSWVIQKEGIASVLVGCRNETQLKNNIHAVMNPISGELVTMLDTLSLPLWNRLGNSPDYYEAPERSRIH